MAVHARKGRVRNGSTDFGFVPFDLLELLTSTDLFWSPKALPLMMDADDKEDFQHHSANAAAVVEKRRTLSAVDCSVDDVPDGKVNSLHTTVMRNPDSRLFLDHPTV